MKIVKYQKAVDAAEKEPSVSTNGANGQKIMKIRKTKMNLVSSNVMGSNVSNPSIAKD